ncbi:MAG: CoA pyrophosphatase [Acidobacteriia bacterium]|nr:CoA pyrophosphatase [Terriglobia bacterium]
MAEPEAAVAVVHARGAAESILLIRRSEREEDSWSGHWSLPGGRRDPQDRDLLDTARRELAEECGIRLSRAAVEAELPAMVARRRVKPYILVTPFVFRVSGELAAVVDPREAVEALWIPLGALRDPARHSLRCVPGRPAELLFPAIELKGAPLWGFTYRLLTDWLGLGNFREQAGLDAAGQVLEFLTRSLGLPLARAWTDGARRGAAGPMVKEAAVSGAIPVTPVLAHFSQPEHFLAAVNCLEVRPGHIRIVGPAFEEYFIRAGKP